HDEYAYLFASLDGWCLEGKRIVEIKCPQEPKDHRIALEGRVPDKYWPQVQHALFVSGAEQLDYVSYRQQQGVIIPVLPDPPFMKQLREAEETFWDWVCSDTFPMPTGDLIGEGDPIWETAIDDYLSAQDIKRQAEAKERRAKLELMRYMGKANAASIKGCGFTVTLRIRKPYMRRPIPAIKVEEGLLLEVHHNPD